MSLKARMHSQIIEKFMLMLMLISSMNAQACYEQAAEAFDLDVDVLRLIGEKLENGEPGQANLNTDNSYDLGKMQINSWWIESGRLDRFEITREMLLTDQCLNIHVGAWILKHELIRHKGNYAKALASYHSPTKVHQKAYLERARNILLQYLKIR